MDMTVPAGAAIERIAARMKIEPAVLQAVVEVESEGHAFAFVKGKSEPLIRFEGHYFDQRLKEPLRSLARQQGLASPVAGKVKNPKDQPGRWAQLAKAMRIDKQAALESISIGVGQVMTAHWAKLGYDSVAAMIAEARSGLDGQIEIMARYIEKFGLVDELQRLDFTGFARGYNGPTFRKKHYHIKMASAYQRISGDAPVSAATGMLRMGSSGAKVRELQALLVRAGYPVKVDGDFGPTTRDAVRAFQTASRIKADGVAGPETMRRLTALKQDPHEATGREGVTETRAAREGLGGVVGVEAARQTIEHAADKTAWVPGLEWLSAILSVIAVALVLAGLAWIAWGWWKSRQTDEGDVLA